MTIGTVANQELSAFLATAFISVKLPARAEMVLAPPSEFPEIPEVYKLIIYKKTLCLYIYI